MQPRGYALMIAVALLPRALAAQASAAAPSANPVADAFRSMEQRYARILVAAAEAMPADRYNFRPTPAQMSFAEIQVHLANEGNDELCGRLTGIAVPKRTTMDTTATKDQLIARLKETFQFCETALAHLDDSKLSTPIQLFGPVSQASAILITVGDWADHYSQEANYLRLNGVLPPTAQPQN
jgi:hypothetical protein